MPRKKSLSRRARDRVKAWWVARQAGAIRGMRSSGTSVVLTGTLALIGQFLPASFPYQLQVTIITIIGFVYTALSHMLAVWSLEHAAPAPECPTCRVRLRPEHWGCFQCGRDYPARG